MKTPTPHNTAKYGDFAKTVLMPGDPLRARFIAENYLENARLVNNVRGINGWTGFYAGKRISVMASGMGMPPLPYTPTSFSIATALSALSAWEARARLPTT